MNIELKLQNIAIKYSDWDDFMELNYLKEIAEEILEKGNVQLVEQFSVKDSVYLKKIITEMFKAGKPSNTSLSKALYIIDVNTKKDNTSFIIFFLYKLALS